MEFRRRQHNRAPACILRPYAAALVRNSPVAKSIFYLAHGYNDIESITLVFYRHITRIACAVRFNRHRPAAKINICYLKRRLPQIYPACPRIKDSKSLLHILDIRHILQAENRRDTVQGYNTDSKNSYKKDNDMTYDFGNCSF